jgi:hypothetical protein
MGAGIGGSVLDEAGRADEEAMAIQIAVHTYVWMRIAYLNGMSRWPPSSFDSKGCGCRLNRPWR